MNNPDAMVAIDYGTKWDTTLVPCSGMTSLDVLLLMALALAAGVFIGLLSGWWMMQRRS